MDPSPFFAYARERQAILLRRRAGLPRSEWTQDPILRDNRFCNVFREDDRTTVWFRENVRERLRSTPEVLLATVVFRWFNRITTGEAIFSQTRMDTEPPGATAWEEFLGSGNTLVLRDAILKHVGWGGPFVTGAYIIKTPNGMDKLDGVLYGIREFIARSGWKTRGEELIEANSFDDSSLQEMWAWLCQFPFLGPFMAYEIVSDLRYTALLDRAPDIMTWANAGPGATRGLNRLYDRKIDRAIPAKQQSEEMRELLEASRSPQNWPQLRDHGSYDLELTLENSDAALAMIGTAGHWPAWDMRTVEHTLCEFDKHQRVLLGQGKMKQRYRPHTDV